MYESEVRCSGVFYWCYVHVPLVFRGVPLVLRGGRLFQHCSRVFHCSTGVPYSVIPLVFHQSAGVPCSVIPCFGVPGFIAYRLFPLYSIVHTGR